jgi:hypothetical protein
VLYGLLVFTGSLALAIGGIALRAPRRGRARPGRGCGHVVGAPRAAACPASRDLVDERDDQDYVAGDLAFNGLFTAPWATGTVAAIQDHSAYALPLGGLTVLHGAMLVHRHRARERRLEPLQRQRARVDRGRGVRATGAGVRRR